MGSVKTDVCTEGKTSHRLHTMHFVSLRPCGPWGPWVILLSRHSLGGSCSLHQGEGAVNDDDDEGKNAVEHSDEDVDR